MYIEIDFNSDEAIYIQLRNQIIVGIATSQLKEGESLPSVRSMADEIGVNMHTVNKAYSSLRQDGFLKVDRRKGAVVSVNIDKLEHLEKMRNCRFLIAGGWCGVWRGGCGLVTSPAASRHGHPRWRDRTSRDIGAAGGTAPHRWGWFRCARLSCT